MPGVAPRAASETLHARRTRLLERLAEIRVELRSEIAQALDSDPSVRAVRLRRVDALDEIAAVAEVELGEIENRLAEEACTDGVGGGACRPPCRDRFRQADAIEALMEDAIHG